MATTIVNNFNRFDLDAIDYIQRVEQADGESLELGVKFAYNKFIKGLKADGLWDSIEASCIMGGARTVEGALTPLKGVAPSYGLFKEYNRYGNFIGVVSGTASHSINTNVYHSNQDLTNFHICSGISRLGAATFDFVEGVGSHISFVNHWNENGLHIIYNGQILNPQSRLPTVGNIIMSLSVEDSGLVKTRSRGIPINYPNLNMPSELNTSLSYRFFFPNIAVYANNTLYYYSLGRSLDLELYEERIATLRSDIDYVLSL